MIEKTFMVSVVLCTEGPEWWLVGVGVLTFIVIGWQAIETRRAAQAAQKSANAAEREMILLNRPYLTIGPWILVNPIPTAGRVEYRYSIFNPSDTAARIETVELTYRGTSEIQTIGRMLTPNDRHWVRHEFENVQEGEAILLRGRITYTDIFRKARHRTFAVEFYGKLDGCQFDEAEGVGWNDEEEWNKDDQQHPN